MTKLKQFEPIMTHIELPGMRVIIRNKAEQKLSVNIRITEYTDSVDYLEVIIEDSE